VTAPPRPAQHRLGRELGWALAFKAVALLVLYAAFFGASHRVVATPDRIAAMILGAAASREGR